MGVVGGVWCFLTPKGVEGIEFFYRTESYPLRVVFVDDTKPPIFFYGCFYVETAAKKKGKKREDAEEGNDMTGMHLD